jgi:O-antigen ligase
MALAVLTLIVKLAYGYPISNSYILFFAFLLAFPLVVREIHEGKYEFYDLTVFLSFGIILAALSSQALLEFSTISRFIEVHEQSAYKRYAGFYGDPNFYAAHVTAAVAGILVLISKLSQVRKRIFLVALLALLAYCGFLSVSKMFLIVTFCIFLLWIFQVLFQRGKVSSKLFTILCVLVFGFFVLSSTLFYSLIDLVVMRLVNSSGNLTDLTTGRLTIWENYLEKLWSQPALLFFGSGYTDIKLDSRSAHNIILQALYQFGITGCMLLVTWFGMYVHNMIRGVKARSGIFMPLIILLWGVVAPWMSLDILFFDEFFLLTFYVFGCMRGLCEAEGID